MKAPLLFSKSSCLALVVCALVARVAFGNAFAQTNTDNPTEAILKSRGLGSELVWLGSQPPSRAESEQLLVILNNLDQPTWTGEVEGFLKANPTSPWAASLHLAYASFCRETGRTTKALEHWEAAWALAKNDSSEKGVNLGSEILNGWMSQLSSLGRLDKLQELMLVGDKWRFATTQQREQFMSAKVALGLMESHPELAYRCGTFALKAVGQRLQPGTRSLESLVEEASPTNGFSVENLLQLAERHGLKLTAVRRSAGAELIVPSVVHWRQNHYAAILEKMDDLYLINDPTSGTPKWYPSAVIEEEASGIFLIPTAQRTLAWETISLEKGKLIRGRGLPNNVLDGKDKGCVPGKPCPPCTGMPVWWVSEPYINLWLADEPLSYLTSRGEPFTFRLTYKQRDTRSTGGWIPVNSWNHSWSSTINLTSTIPCAGSCGIPTFAYADATLNLPDGGEVSFPTTQRYDSESRLTLGQTFPSLTMSGNWDYGDNGLRVTHPDGSQDIYGWVISYTTVSGGYPKATCPLTRRIDSHGNTTWFFYEFDGGSGYRVKRVVDYDGKTNTLSYGTNKMLTAVTNGYGKAALFVYDQNKNLTNITDAVGMLSRLKYDANNYPTNLITPYGTNKFELVETTPGGQGNFGGHNAINRAVRATDPMGATQLYLYRYDSSSFMPTNVAANEVPVSTPLNTLDDGTGATNSLSAYSFRNSFYWNARQYGSLSTTTLTNFTANDYLRGRLRHWLQDTNELYLTGLLSLERAASPDGTTEGLKTFYDYPGKTYKYVAGTNSLPSVTAWRLPGGETHYEYLRYNDFGFVTNRVTTYTKTDGTAGTRTNQYTYASNTYTNVIGTLDASGNIINTVTNSYTLTHLLTQEIAADSTTILQLRSYDNITWTNDFYKTLDTNRVLVMSKRVLPRYVTNAVNEVTTNLYSGYNKLAGVLRPTGLTTTNFFDASWFLTRSVDIEVGRTNGFSYTVNGVVQSCTNELGVVTTNTWDDLLRLTSSADDRGYISNRFNNLDLIAERDRLGSWRNYGYDRAQRLVAATNELNQVTYLSWCGCGTLESITNALGEVTSFAYDQQSRLNTLTFSPSIYLNLSYDLAGRMVNVTDSSGVSLNLGHNNQGLLMGLTNAYGEIHRTIFDVRDRPIWSKSSAGVWTTNTFDGLDRVLTSRIAIGNAERFGYGPAGLNAYTNQIDQITRWVYDAGARPLRVTNHNQEVLQFAYDPANNLTNLLDGKNQKTAWRFDSFSRLTNKLDDLNNPVLALAYDSNDRITNRWTPAKGNAVFKWDPASRLTNIVYAVSPAIVAKYDALGRVTNLVDALGTSSFRYSRLGALASEDGPWASDTVTNYFGNAHRLASSAVARPSAADWGQTYLYDAAGRMTNTTTPAGGFGYGYAGASELIEKLMLGNAGAVTNAYDVVARLTGTYLKQGGTGLDAHSYGYNNAHQRTAQTNVFGNRWSYGYDGIGQLTSALGSEANGTARAQEQLTYGYDKAWNLAGRTNNGFAQVFTNDTRNQLTNVSRSGSFTVAGSTFGAASSVTVNGGAATLYSDRSYVKTGVTLADGNNTFTAVAQNAAGQTATDTASFYLPTAISLSYDSNGNLTNDGRRTFVYDDENQLVTNSVASTWKSEFVYDGFGRKRITRDYGWTGSAWSLTNEIRYVYNGMWVVQERDASNNPLVTYTRGLDLSGSLQGAGGIGGLLARTDHSLAASGAYLLSTAYYHNDGVGNVTALVATNGLLVARYAYDPYGNLIGMDGPLASANHYRFSSKEYHPNSGLYYYGFRFYEPNLQRWPNRDPMEEEYDVNLYRYVYNSPLNYVDPDGLWGIQFGDFNIGWGDPNLAFDSDSWNDLGQGAAATMDGLIPFFDPFKDKYDPCDPIFAWSYAGGEIAQNALLTAAGLRAGAWLGGTRFGHGLNHNPYFRIGPGRWGGGMRPRISIGPQRPGIPNPHIPL